MSQFASRKLTIVTLFRDWETQLSIEEINNYKGGIFLINNLLAVDLNPIIQPILEVLDAILWPLIAIVVAVGTIYCVFLGVKIAKSDEQNSREKAKKDLIGAIIGFVIIFVLIVALKIAVPILEEWVRSQI